MGRVARFLLFKGTRLIKTQTFLYPCRHVSPPVFAQKSVAVLHITSRYTANQVNVSPKTVPLPQDVDGHVLEEMAALYSARHIPEPKMNEILSVVRRVGFKDTLQAVQILKLTAFLNYSSPSDRMKYTHDVWNLIQNSDCFKNEEDMLKKIALYNALLEVYLYNKHKFAPEDFLRQMEKDNTRPDKRIISQIVIAFCNQGNMLKASEVLNNLDFQRMHPDCIGALIKGYLKANDPNGIKTLTKIAYTKGMGHFVKAALLEGYADLGDVESIKKVIIPEIKGAPFSKTNTNIVHWYVNAVMALFLRGLEDDGYEILKMMTDKKLIPESGINGLIRRLICHGHGVIAKKLSTTYKVNSTFSKAFRSVIKYNEPNKVLLDNVETFNRTLLQSFIDLAKEKKKHEWVKALEDKKYTLRTLNTDQLEKQLTDEKTFSAKRMIKQHLLLRYYKLKNYVKVKELEKELGDENLRAGDMYTLAVMYMEIDKDVPKVRKYLDMLLELRGLDFRTDKIRKFCHFLLEHDEFEGMKKLWIWYNGKYQFQRMGIELLQEMTKKVKPAQALDFFMEWSDVSGRSGTDARTIMKLADLYVKREETDILNLVQEMLKRKMNCFDTILLHLAEKQDFETLDKVLGMCSFSSNDSRDMYYIFCLVGANRIAEAEQLAKNSKKVNASRLLTRLSYHFVVQKKIKENETFINLVAKARLIFPKSLPLELLIRGYDRVEDYDTLKWTISSYAEKGIVPRLSTLKIFCPKLLTSGIIDKKCCLDDEETDRLLDSLEINSLSQNGDMDQNESSSKEKKKKFKSVS